MLKNIFKFAACILLATILIYCTLALLKYGFVAIIYSIVIIVCGSLLYYLYKK